jgi:hypothetical protein
VAVAFSHAAGLVLVGLRRDFVVVALLRDGDSASRFWVVAGIAGGV